MNLHQPKQTKNRVCLDVFQIDGSDVFSKWTTILSTSIWNNMDNLNCTELRIKKKKTALSQI